MSTTKKILIAVIIILILGLGFLWYTSRPTEQGGEVTTGRFNIRNFLPFGDSETTSDENADQNSPENNSTNSNLGNNGATGSIVKFRKLWNSPVAGATIVGSGTSSVVRLTEKATGNVYEVKVTGESKRLTNETLPRIARAFWLSDGTGFLAQSVDEQEMIETAFIKLTPTSSTSTETLTPYKITISNLPTGITELAVSPDNKKIFYLVEENGIIGYTSNLDGTNATKVFTNFFSEWIPQWFSPTGILISSKASAETASLGLILNPTTKQVTKKYSNFLGASALSRKDGKFILLGSGGLPELLVKNSTSTNATAIGTKTLPEKCVWDPSDDKFVICAIPKTAGSNMYPDTWYQGVTTTDDSVERINVFDLYTFILSDLKRDGGEIIDATELQSSKDGKFVILTNKRDHSLWLLAI